MVVVCGKSTVPRYRVMNGYKITKAHNPEVTGSNSVPAILITQEKPVTYDWLFSCAKVEILGLGLPGACLGV